MPTTMPGKTSPFLAQPEHAWICSNQLAFALYDGFPVSPGHALVVTKRLVPTWFEATPDEQRALMDLVGEVKTLLDQRLTPKPDGYNVGFNSGAAAGQTVPHVHIHVIPRYTGDMPDPRGGVRHVIPSKGNYLAKAPEPGADKVSGSSKSAPESWSLTAGAPASPLWQRLRVRLAEADSCDVLSSFVQPSGLDLLNEPVFRALATGARIRILIGDYMYITSPHALRRLLGWMALAVESGEGIGCLYVRLAQTRTLIGKPESFHPKAWRIADAAGGLLIVGSSNLSRPALVTGVEWNLVGDGAVESKLGSEIHAAFDSLWTQSQPLTEELVQAYERGHAEQRRKLIPAESNDVEPTMPRPRPWQLQALERLEQIRQDKHRRALVAVATGLGKTWLAAMDLLRSHHASPDAPRVIVIAHRAQILAQAEATFGNAMRTVWPMLRASYFLGASGDLSGSLVVASIQKLARNEGLEQLAKETFDYAVIDEVHHAHAPSYRRVLARLNARFTLGLTATPERSDGVDVATLFDDILAWHANIGDGIAEGSLVPFHYRGLRDDVDYRSIPWRNGKFEVAELETRLLRSNRMDRLWKEWIEEASTRTLVFCCSRRHALFVRDWLRSKGVRAAAVFSGTGGDARGPALEAFNSGEVEALCAVDLFNEGLDVPALDRVVFLRPTESRVVFLQQLGRGLRASEGKTRLNVIDFVGNHRVFAGRLIHLMSLAGMNAGWDELAKWIRDGICTLPDGCLIDVEVEAKQLLEKLLPKAGSIVAETYRRLRDELGRRPSPSELLHKGVLPMTLSARHGSWFEFVGAEGDLSDLEQSCLKRHGQWFRTVQSTALNYSYKMVALRVLLDRDALWSGLELEDFARSCRDFLLNHPSLHEELPPTKEFPDPANAPLKDWAKWWRTWPMSKWLQPQTGTVWFRETKGRFHAAFECQPELKSELASMTSELVDYRIAHYSRVPEAAGGSGADEVIAKVSHSSGNPILRFRETAEEMGRPVGLIPVVLPNGERWTFRFVKIACNVATPEGTTSNELPRLLRSWFGTEAGLPGTDRRVRFKRTLGNEWSIEPIGTTTTNAVPKDVPSTTETEDQHARKILPPGARIDIPDTDKFVHFAPVYRLKAAAGGWGSDQELVVAGWLKTRGQKLTRDHFVAHVSGHSMEPKIPAGSWCLFRKVRPGSRQGKVLLVQLRAQTDPETRGRFTVKTYHSEMQVNEGEVPQQKVELRPYNPAYEPITIAPEDAEEMRVLGEFVSVL